MHVACMELQPTRVADWDDLIPRQAVLLAGRLRDEGCPRS